MPNKKGKILLLDNNELELDTLAENLVRKNFEVETALNGQGVLNKVKQFSPDIIILDWNLDPTDGITICRIIRANPDYNRIFIVFLTAHDNDFSKIEGYDSGADEYILKGIKFLVLVAKIEALFRRKIEVKINNTRIKFHDLIIKPHKKRVRKDGKKIKLTKIEYNLFILFLSDRAKIFSREEIYNIIWGEDIIVGDRTLDVHIRNLRKKIGKNIVVTHKGQEYSLAEE